MREWFHALTGFEERSYAETQSNLVVEGHTLRSTINHQSYVIGELETPSLADLRAHALAVAHHRGSSNRPPLFELRRSAGALAKAEEPP